MSRGSDRHEVGGWKNTNNANKCKTFYEVVTFFHSFNVASFAKYILNIEKMCLGVYTSLCVW